MSSLNSERMNEAKEEMERELMGREEGRRLLVSSPDRNSFRMTVEESFLEPVRGARMVCAKHMTTHAVVDNMILTSQNDERGLR